MHKSIQSIINKLIGVPKSTVITKKPASIRTGTTVKIISGKEGKACGLGDIGKVHHTCELTGFRYITLKKHRKDPLYATHVFGPFVDIELEVQQ